MPGHQVKAKTFYEQDTKNIAEAIGEKTGILDAILANLNLEVHEENLLETLKNRVLPIIRDQFPLPDAFYDQYLQDLERLYDKLPRQIIHRDLNPSNWIVTNGPWGVIEFGQLEKSVRIYDPCYAALAILSEVFDDSIPDILPKWLDIYQSILKGYDHAVLLTATEKEAIPYIILANQFICCAWLAHQNRYLYIFETNLKMTQWLIKNFQHLKLQSSSYLSSSSK